MRFQKPTPWSLSRSRDVLPLIAGTALGVGNFFTVPSLVLYSGGAISFLIHFLALLILGVTLLVGEILWSRWLLRPYWQSYQVFRKPKSWFFPFFSFFAVLFVVPPYVSDLGHILMLFSQSTLSRLVGFEAWVVQGSEESVYRFLFSGVVATLCFAMTRISPAKMAKTFFVLILVSIVCFMVVCAGIGAHWGFENIRLLFYWDESRINLANIFKNSVFSFFTLSVGFGVVYHFFYYASQRPWLEENKTHLSFWRKPGGVFKLVGWIVFLDLLMSFMALVMVSPFAESELQKTSLFRNDTGLEGHFVNSDILILDWVPLVLSRASGGSYLEACLYLGLLLAGIASVVSLLDLCVFSFETELSWSRAKSALHVFGFLVISLSLTWFQQISQAMKFLGAEIFLPLSALILCLLVGWRMPKRYQSQIVGRGLILDRLFDLWRFSIRYVTPAFIVYYFYRLIKSL